MRWRRLEGCPLAGAVGPSEFALVCNCLAFVWRWRSYQHSLRKWLRGVRESRFRHDMGCASPYHLETRKSPFPGGGSVLVRLPPVVPCTQSRQMSGILSFCRASVLFFLKKMCRSGDVVVR